MSKTVEMNPCRVVWCDLETTGLVPSEICILEIAVVITDAEFNVLASYEAVLQAPPRETLKPFILEMHTANGLLDECDRSYKTAYDAAHEVLQLLQQHDAFNAPLGGASVHADRSWLEYHMPQLASALHYRNVDASCAKVLAASIGARFPRAPNAHRAMPDILASIELAKRARDYGTGWHAAWLHVKAIFRLLLA